MSSKSKGNRFELKMLRKLRELWPDLHRTIGSGSAKDESADAIGVVCPYLFEFKHRKRINKKDIDRFFSKLRQDVINEDIEKRPILIYKEDFRPVMVVRECWIASMNAPVPVIEFFDDWFNRQKRYHDKEETKR